MTQAHNDFLIHGGNLASSNWSAWWTAFQYAVEIKSPLLPLIDRGCSYAEDLQHVPDRYLKAAQKLLDQACDAVACEAV